MDEIRKDFAARSPRDFEHRYPGYLERNCNWTALRRDRRKNGTLDSGALVERRLGDHRHEIRIVPALLHEHFTGEAPERAVRDLWLEEVKLQNQRLLALESRLEALTRVLSDG